jgi:serine/threonine-protein kinase
VSWHDAVAYCAWRSEVEGCEVRLPTEAEWEKASRGVDGRWFPWGRRFDASLCNMRNSLQQGARPLPIDKFPDDRSVYGVRGTAGNVRDWTATVVSDSDAEEGDTRVVRGGAWNLPAVISRSANRFWLSPSFVLNYVGFRVVRSVSP